MAKYVAFPRGINVGGHNKIKMADLRQGFASWGFQNVKTLLASGNIIFEAQDTDPDVLASTIGKRIDETFRIDVSVIVRTLDQIKSLLDENPFDGVTITKQTRLYVTFLSEPHQSRLKIPYESLEKDFKILRATDCEVYSVLTLTPQSGTIKAMGILEKEFGENITTRNWNTVTKIALM